MTYTLTITDAGSSHVVIAAYDDPDPRVHVVDIYTTLPPALDAAYAIVYPQPQPPHPLPRTLTDFTPRSPTNLANSANSTQVGIRLSQQAWDYLQRESAYYGYKGHSLTTGFTHYLLALLAANPTSPTTSLLAHWTDTRPPDLKMFDAARLNSTRHSPRRQFPYWARQAYGPANQLRGVEQAKRGLNRAHFTQAQPLLLNLADHFFIAPYSGNQTSPRARAAAVIEAIGLNYLTPRNPPAQNPRPVDPKQRHRYVKKHTNVELVF